MIMESSGGLGTAKSPRSQWVTGLQHQAAGQPEPGATSVVSAVVMNVQWAPSNLQWVGCPGVPFAMIRILTSCPAGAPHGHGTADATPPSSSLRAVQVAPVTESICTPRYRNASRQ